MGRVTKYTNEEDFEFFTNYDAVGNVVSLTDAYGNTVTSNEYDEVNALITSTDALEIETQFEYDTVGNVIKTIEYLNTARQTETSYTYDSIGRILTSTDALEGTASYVYDGFGNIKSMEYPGGGQTAYSYDNAGRLTETTNALGNKNSFSYNALGLLETDVNARNQETTYTYYKNGWIKSFTDELGTVSYTYDGNGNVLTVTDKNGTITREYDRMNRMTKYTDFRGNIIEYGYDQIGNLVTLTYPGGRIVHYTYNSCGQILTATDWDGRITSYEYDGNGQLTKTSRPDGSVEIRAYDLAGQLISQVDKNGETVINAKDYGYDESGNITSISSANSSIGSLTSAEMEYDADNKLIKWGGEDVLYDADGNMTYGPLNGEMTEFVYDCRNRLVSAGGISYEYDAENNRISQTANEVQTQYVVDTSQPLSQILTTETAGVKTYFVHGNGLISQEKDSVVLFFHFNNIGSTEVITREDGSIAQKFEYGPYGELTSENLYGIIFLYNGQLGVVTDDNGLLYMRARYYSPEIKRFINQDVLIGEITDSPTLNRYAYVNGSPINLNDPFGLAPSLKWLGHAFLDVLGFIPIVGGLADLANAAWYFADGDYVAGACSLVAAIPFAGDAIGAGCTAMKWTKAACAVSKYTKIAGNVGKFAVGAYNSYNVVSNAVTSIKNGNYSVGQFFVDSLTLGLSGYSMKTSFDGFKSGLKDPVCFVAGTLVAAECGFVPIEDVEAGDLVWSENPETGEKALKQVVRTFVNETDELVHVYVNGEEIVTTPNRPFYVAKLGWTAAAELRAGDVLVLLNGEYVVVEWVQHELLEAPVTVYNFEVEDFHTYFVSDSAVLVHNTCGNVQGSGHGKNAKHKDTIDATMDSFENYGYGTSGLGGDYDAIYGNRSLKTAGFKGSQQPDIITVRTETINGSSMKVVDIYEFASPTQAVGTKGYTKLTNKITDMKIQNPNTNDTIFNFFLFDWDNY